MPNTRRIQNGYEVSDREVSVLIMFHSYPAQRSYLHIISHSYVWSFVGQSILRKILSGQFFLPVPSWEAVFSQSLLIIPICSSLANPF